MPNQAELHSRLLQSLDHFRDPETGRPLSKTSQVTDWKVTPTQVECTLWLTSHSQPIAEETTDQFRDHLLSRFRSAKRRPMGQPSRHRRSSCIQRSFNDQPRRSVKLDSRPRASSWLELAKVALAKALSPLR